MRFRWVAAAGLAVLTAVAAAGRSSPRAALHAEDTGRLVFDLEAGEVTIGDHVARITWHLAGDNIVNSSVGAAWYSSYLEQPGRLGGRIVVDFDAGTVEGALTEEWECSGECDGWMYREAEITAEITEGRLESDAAGWRLTGTVDIAYHARGGRDESPSQCRDVECYICRDRFCTFDSTGSASTQLSGWLRDGSLALAFSDGLPEDVEDLDVSGLQEAEYFKTRVAVTVAGAALESTGSTPTEPVDTTAGSTPVEPGPGDGEPEGTCRRTAERRAQSVAGPDGGRRCGCRGRHRAGRYPPQEGMTGTDSDPPWGLHVRSTPPTLVAR